LIDVADVVSFYYLVPGIINCLLLLIELPFILNHHHQHQWLTKTKSSSRILRSLLQHSKQNSRARGRCTCYSL